MARLKRLLWRFYINAWRGLGMGVYEDKRWDKDGIYGDGPDDGESRWMASTILISRGRVQRRDRRFQVRAWRRGNKYASGPWTYHRTHWMARVSAAFFAVFGYRVELWDVNSGIGRIGAR